jgi:hypothetical protein
MHQLFNRLHTAKEIDLLVPFKGANDVLLFCLHLAEHCYDVGSWLMVHGTFRQYVLSL